MATSNLQRCARCGKPLRVTGGTDPGRAGSGYVEQYECPDGHTGTYSYEVTPSGAVEQFSGACR